MNKYNLTWQTHYKLKCLNQNNIDEGIIITTTRFTILLIKISIDIYTYNSSVSI
jgi:hypothetical protein